MITPTNNKIMKQKGKVKVKYLILDLKFHPRVIVLKGKIDKQLTSK